MEETKKKTGLIIYIALNVLLFLLIIFYSSLSSNMLHLFNSRYQVQYVFFQFMLILFSMALFNYIFYLVGSRKK